MDIISRITDTEIEKVCREVYCQIKDNSHQRGSDSIELLRKLCGKSECSCTSLTPAQHVGGILSVAHCGILNYTVAYSVMSNYSSLSSEVHCQRALEKTLIWVLNADTSQQRLEFLAQFWIYRGLKKFHVSVVEDFIFKESRYLEEDMFSIFEKVIRKEKQPGSLWAEESYRRLVLWSCDSTKIFIAVTSIMNCWFMKVVGITSQYTLGLSVVNSFIQNVKQKCACSNKDFVLLYPREYHSLVALLEMDPNLFPESSVNDVVKLVRESIDKNKVQTQCLLTHFSQWLTFIER